MRDITMCHPRLQALASKLTEECEKQGLIIKIGECYRTVEEQNALYAQGRTEPGSIVTNAKGSSYSSQHQWGIAFDFFRNDGNGAYNESGDFFEKVGAVGKGLGLGWGGDWKSIVDKPHLYLPDWGSTTSELRKKYGTPEKFKKDWPSAELNEGFVLDSGSGLWKYQFKDGSYATGWHWLTERTGGTSGWYYFDVESCMLTGYIHDDAKEPYFLCPDKSIHEGQCMISDARGVLQFAIEYDFENRRYQYEWVN